MPLLWRPDDDARPITYAEGMVGTFCLLAWFVVMFYLFLTPS